MGARQPRRHDGEESPRPAVRRISGLGVACFVVALAMAALNALVIQVGVAVALRVDAIDLVANSPAAVLVGFGLFLGCLGEIFAIVLANIGLSQRDRKKGFAAAGLAIAAFGLFALLGLVILESVPR